MRMKTKKDDPVLIYTTYPSLVEASKAGRALVETGLCACVNIIPGMRSIYRWEGRIEEAEETVMILKTRAGHVTRVTGAVKRSHPYEMPAVLVLPVSGGNQAYIDWILTATGKASS